MSSIANIFMVLVSASVMVSCKEEKTKHSSSSGAASANQVVQSGLTGNGFYTGIGGNADFSLMLPGFGAYTITDPSIAKIEEIKVTLSDATINDLVAEVKAKDSTFDEAQFRAHFPKDRTAYKVTPLKAGQTTMSRAQQGGGRSMGTWGSSSLVPLVVYQYSQDQLDAGQRRYTTDGGGNLKACKSCHETGAEGAPSHQLGRVMEISDDSVIEWVTTGKTGGRVAKITHTWEFSSDDEKKGIVPYLRSLQTHDLETLTKLYFEEAQANGFKGMPQGPH